MEIHELNTFTGTPGQTDYLAIDSGQETCKIPAGNLGVTDNMTLAEAKAGTETGSRVIQPSVFKQAVSELSDILIVSVSSFSSLPKTVSNSNVTSDMVVIKAELGTPSAQTSDWDVTTSNGSLGITGTISGSTTLKLYLAKSR